jgi:hypothetical protein
MSAPDLDALAARLQAHAAWIRVCERGAPLFSRENDIGRDCAVAAAALLAAREEREGLLALVAECAELVDRLRELRAPRDIEEGSLILNTCDYYALDDLAERLRAARPAPETAE